MYEWLATPAAAGGAGRNSSSLKLLEVIEHLEHGVARVYVRLVVDRARHRET